MGLIQRADSCESSLRPKGRSCFSSILIRLRVSFAQRDPLSCLAMKPIPSLYRICSVAAALFFLIFCALAVMDRGGKTGPFLSGFFALLAPAVFGPLMNITGSSLATRWRAKPVTDGSGGVPSESEISTTPSPHA